MRGEPRAAGNAEGDVPGDCLEGMEGGETHDEGKKQGERNRAGTGLTCPKQLKTDMGAGIIGERKEAKMAGNPKKKRIYPPRIGQKILTIPSATLAGLSILFNLQRALD